MPLLSAPATVRGSAASAPSSTLRGRSAHSSAQRASHGWFAGLTALIVSCVGADETSIVLTGVQPAAAPSAVESGVDGAAGSGAVQPTPAGGQTPAGGGAEPGSPAGGDPASAAPAGAGVESLGLSSLRIVAVGDSITQSTCWRALLWQRLSQDFPDRFEFVGSHQSDAGCSPSGYDQDNEGYGSALVTEVTAGITDRRTCNPACPTLDDLRSRFSAAPADVALLHFGTNDVWNGIATETIVQSYSAVVEALRAANPSVVVLVAQIIPMNVTETTCTGCTCAGCPTAVPALNARIMSWAAETATSGSPVRVVDQFTGFDAVADNRDGVHPTTTTGSQKMADRWYDALAPLF